MAGEKKSWMETLQAVYKAGLAKNKNYKYSQAMKDAKNVYKKQGKGKQKGGFFGLFGSGDKEKGEDKGEEKDEEKGEEKEKEKGGATSISEATPTSEIDELKKANTVLKGELDKCKSELLACRPSQSGSEPMSSEGGGSRKGRSGKSKKMKRGGRKNGTKKR